MADIKPLPCPFCGGTPFIHENDWSDPPQLIVMCNTPDCSGMGPHENTEGEAVAAWNRRSQDPTREELARALEGVIRVADRKTVEFDAARAALSKHRDHVEGGR